MHTYHRHNQQDEKKATPLLLIPEKKEPAPLPQWCRRSPRYANPNYVGGSQ